MRKLVFGVAAAFCFLAACSGADDSILFQDAAAPDDVVVDTGPPPLTKSSKLDMLFAIDNSASMGDKQELLVQAMPQFLDRLSSPWCNKRHPGRALRWHTGREWRESDRKSDSGSRKNCY